MKEKERPEKSDGVSRPDIPATLGVLPLRDAVLFPHSVLPLAVGRESSVLVVDEAMLGSCVIAMITQRDPAVEEPGPDDLYQIGTAAMIHKALKYPDGTMRLVVQGLARIRVLEVMQRSPFLRAYVEVLQEVTTEGDLEVEALARSVAALFQKIVALSPTLSDDLAAVVMNERNPGRLADLVATTLPSLSTPLKHALLERQDVKARLQDLTAALAKEAEVLELGTKIQSQVHSEMSRSQREYYLREQMKAIQKELGETDERVQEVDELRNKIEAAGMPDEALKASLRELDRLAKMPPASAEYTVARTYLDMLLSLPWQKETPDEVDLARASQVLDEDHFGLEKVKERILESLAIRKIRPDVKGPILCFVGPPGVGKTSLGRSIARALGRKFARISLGGMRDEAEIRGHRRTYIGALPGQIIQGLRRAESKNAVFMLDEVDKLGHDFRGDPASALLEVLDPEQNQSFRDHYLDVTFDLSKVLFITTANVLDPIPPALRDRMEVIELPGYTEEEKLAIAQQHLLPRQAGEHGLRLGGEIAFRDDALRLLIQSYTREAGLRNLEREIATLCRKVARQTAEGQTELTEITRDRVTELLGAPKFHREELTERTRVPGVAVGLAWTPVGGEILFIEATKMRGGRNLLLTGQLGDVMKESAQTALSWIRSHADWLQIDPEFWEKWDIHVHIPAGAIPKDGPSAGIAMLTSMVSLLRGQPVQPGLAMTGETTLSGRVLPVGGIKDKVLAARRAGIREVVLPAQNRDVLLEDVPAHIRREMSFRLVLTVEEVLTVTFPGAPWTRLPETAPSGAEGPWGLRPLLG